MERDAEQERAALVAALNDVVRGAAADQTTLTTLATRFGAAHAVEGQSITTVLEVLEQLEGDVQRTLAAEPSGAPAPSDGNDAVPCAAAYRVHELCAAMRRDALRAFGRTARHDAVNAIGAARNAVLLIAEDRESDDRRRFVEIAKRNLQIAERLVRSQFAEDEILVRRDSAASMSSRRDQGKDLRRASEGDHLDSGSL
jgi:hypothetical protein